MELGDERESPKLIIADRYRLGEKLGEGGMGTVWRAEHTTLKSPVVIKLLAEAIAQSPEALDRFMREAQASAALRSMHVVQIFDYGVDDGVPYIAMEMLNGESMQDRLDRLGCLTTADAAKFMTHVARAMGKAHDAGIIHRDLKPDNIYLVQEDEEIAKVLDFGIAKIADGATGGDHGNTRTGTVLGTPYYMSPEQAQGTKAIDWRTDLWAMAVIGYQCVTGQRPFDSEALGELLLKICVGEAPMPSRAAANVPPALDVWFARGVHKDPDQRFQSAQELAEAYSAALSGAEFARVDAATPASIAFAQSQPGFIEKQLGFASDRSVLNMTTGAAATVDELPIRRIGPTPWIIGGVVAVAGVAVTLALMLSEPDPGPDAEAAGQGSASAHAAASPVIEPPVVEPEAPPALPTVVEPEKPDPAETDSPDATTPLDEQQLKPKAKPVIRTRPKETPRPVARKREPRPQPTPKPTVKPTVKPKADPEPIRDSDLFNDRK